MGYPKADTTLALSSVSPGDDDSDNSDDEDSEDDSDIDMAAPEEITTNAASEVVQPEQHEE